MSLIQLMPRRQVCIWHETLNMAAASCQRRSQLSSRKQARVSESTLQEMGITSEAFQNTCQHHLVTENNGMDLCAWIHPTLNVVRMSSPPHSFTSINTTTQQVNIRLSAQNPSTHRCPKTSTKFGNLSILHILKSKAVCRQ